MQALTLCDAKVVSTRTAVGQFKGQFKGAMERYTWVRFAGKLTSDCHRTHSNGQNISEAMESYMRGFDLAQNSQGSATRHRQQ
jgi:hypothetical protein